MKRHDNLANTPPIEPPSFEESHKRSEQKVIDINISLKNNMPIIGLNSEFDFKAQNQLSESFGPDYLRQYYHPSRPVTDDEMEVYRFIKSITPHLTGTEDCLEIGCGPTVHHAIMLAPYVKHLSLSDYLEENLRLVNLWIDSHPDAWSWKSYTEYCNKIDGIYSNASSIESRESLTKSKIIETLPINILTEHPLGHLDRKYDLISTFYCTEEVALNVDRWKRALGSVTSLLKKDGHLLMSCLNDSDFYHICDTDGIVRELPCARITESILRDALNELGYVVNTDTVLQVKTPSQQAEGVPGILLVFAKLA